MPVFEHRVNFGFVADLCAANEWALTLHLAQEDPLYVVGDDRASIEDRKLVLRVYSARPWRSGEMLAGVRFPAGASLDEAAENVFASLTASGSV